MWSSAHNTSHLNSDIMIYKGISQFGKCCKTVLWIGNLGATVSRIRFIGISRTPFGIINIISNYVTIILYVIIDLFNEI